LSPVSPPPACSSNAQKAASVQEEDARPAKHNPTLRFGEEEVEEEYTTSSKHENAENEGVRSKWATCWAVPEKAVSGWLHKAHIA
jgi:hypothetical protein